VGGDSAEDVVGGRGDSEGRRPVTVNEATSDDGKWEGATGVDAIEGSCEPDCSSSVCDIRQMKREDGEPLCLSSTLSLAFHQVNVLVFVAYYLSVIVSGSSNNK
jgi:hypothetical protein